MPVHYAAYGAIAVVKAVVVKGAVAAHHIIAKHALATALAGTGSIATIAYLDHAQLMRWYREQEPGLKVDRTVKFAIAGKLIKGEFTTIVEGQPVNTVMQGFMDASTQEVLHSRVVKARRIDSSLAGALAGGGMVVYN
jgi:hypothetical protein